MITDCEPRWPTPSALTSMPSSHTRTQRKHRMQRGASVVDRLGPFLFRLVAFFLGEPALIRAVGKKPCPAIRTRRPCRIPGNPAGDWQAGIRASPCAPDEPAPCRCAQPSPASLPTCRPFAAGRLFNFDQAHATGRLQRQAREVAERRNFDPHAAAPPRSQRTRRDRHIAVVNLQRDIFRICHFGPGSLTRHGQ